MNFKSRMKLSKFLSLSVMSVVISSLVACSSMDEIPKTNLEYAPVWEYAPRSDAAISVEKEWWKAFESKQLTQLVEIAQQKNPDWLKANESVKQAELQMKIANASLFPSLSLSASTGESRSKSGVVNLPDDDGNWKGSSTSKVGLSASYEIDLWGGAMAERHAAKANYKSSVYDNEATRLSISAAVATAWFNFVALQERFETAKKNVEIADRIQRIVDSLYRNGAASAADVAAQKSNLLSQQNALLPLQLQLDQTRAAIAVLEGQAPQGYQLARENILDIKIPVINTGVPADVIVRRPDVASTEAKLQKSSADIYAARTALLPSVKLNGSLGESASGLFSLSPAKQSADWSLALAQTIFAGGTYINKVKISESARVALVEDYRKVILTALQEADDALNRVNITLQQETNQQDIVEQSARSLKLNETRYREGDIDLQSLLDSQRSLFQAQDALVQQRLARLKAAVDLYKALGGGWQNT